ncbi:MAG: type 4a pilus biogenesis protein PilO [Alphaproteobacteria bacterium]|nr:type 4a pilus biogenesis protein PilO [Alphaproteobacteria bacterium]
MNASRILEQLGRLPRSQRLLLFGLGYVLIAGLYVGLLYLPASTRISELGDEMSALNQQKVVLEQRIRDKERYEAELQTLMADLKEALKELPNDREIPGLLKGISGMGKKVGLEVRKFQPLPEVKREYVAEVPVALEVSGSYHEVALFFERLSKMNRIVYVQNLELGDPKNIGGEIRLTVTGNAVTFRFLSEEELEKGKAKGKRGKQN